MTDAEFGGVRAITVPDERLCSVCHGTKYIISSHGESHMPGRAIPCPAQCNQSENRLKLKGRSNMVGGDLGIYLRNSAFHPSIKSDIDTLISMLYNENPAGFVYLHGPNGSGKTYIQKAAINEMIQQGRGGIYFTSIRLLNKVRSKFNDSNRRNANQDYIDYLKNVTLLCIDEFGREKQTDYGEQVLFDIINDRYNSSFTYDNNSPAKITIMAGNLHVNQMDTYLSSRLQSRNSMIMDLTLVPDWRQS